MANEGLLERNTGIITRAICIVALIAIIAVNGLHPNTLRLRGMTVWIAHLLTALIVTDGLWAVQLPIPVWLVLIGGAIEGVWITGWT